MNFKLKQRGIVLPMIAFFAFCFLYGCNTYKNTLPNSFYAVMDNPKFADGEIMLFRFYICENDTFSITINGVQLYDKYTPSNFSECTYLDDHTTDGYASYNYDFVIYQCSQKRAVMYLLNNQSISFSIPLRNQSIDISGSYSPGNFNFSVPMGNCKQFIVHHFHNDTTVVRKESLQGIRFYE